MCIMYSVFRRQRYRSLLFNVGGPLGLRRQQVFVHLDSSPPYVHVLG